MAGIESRARFIDRIRTEYPDAADRFAGFNWKLVRPALNALTLNQRFTAAAFASIANGIMHDPQHIDIAGRALEQLRRDERLELVRYVVSVPYVHRFMDWFNGHVSDDRDMQVLARITVKNTDHALERWILEHNGKFPEPDWQALETSYMMYMRGINSGLHSWFTRLHDGLQTSSIEVFMEDEPPVISREDLAVS